MPSTDKELILNEIHRIGTDYLAKYPKSSWKSLGHSHHDTATKMKDYQPQDKASAIELLDYLCNTFKSVCGKDGSKYDSSNLAKDIEKTFKFVFSKETYSRYLTQQTTTMSSGFFIASTPQALRILRAVKDLIINEQSYAGLEKVIKDEKAAQAEKNSVELSTL